MLQVWPGTEPPNRNLTTWHGGRCSDTRRKLQRVRCSRSEQRQAKVRDHRLNQGYSDWHNLSLSLIGLTLPSLAQLHIVRCEILRRPSCCVDNVVSLLIFYEFFWPACSTRDHPADDVPAETVEDHVLEVVGPLRQGHHVRHHSCQSRPAGFDHRGSGTEVISDN